MSAVVTALISVLLGSLGQFLLKVGVTRMGGVQYGGGGELAATVIKVAQQPAILGGVVLFATSMMLWLGVLSRMDLSKAQPMIALSYAFVPVLSRLFLGETVGLTRVAGIGLILMGVVLAIR